MAHLTQVPEDLLDRVFGTGPFGVHDVGCQELRRGVAYRQCRDAILTGAVAGEEVICTDGGSASRLDVHSRAGRTA